MSKISWIVLITAFLVLTFSMYFGKLAERDQKLMELCADHATQTLYECDNK